MTWTLRLYDDAGVEIGWVSVDDTGLYSFEITHPDAGWVGLKASLSGWENIHGEMDTDPVDRGSEITFYVDPAPIQNTLAPEEHLERVQTGVESHPEVASTALSDE
ncbi:hypothetical protein HRTV-25_gp20 [Halorubrum tailed virus 25]|uniref:Uncharacterized protein n=1 Tax=Halorubrum tailed virus 25 TaxID=2878006 RepID=A0AAE9BZ26_9CAUD|nr:hypothetical protein M1M37_gp020 [Halorubrum tailed virus 25]UBF22601.1 hypothetical protein HRTV-25_gp20 [Halorubrum tailed virus 25]